MDVLRELAEESGILHATVVEKIGELDLDEIEQHWRIYAKQQMNYQRNAPFLPPPAVGIFFISSGTSWPKNQMKAGINTFKPRWLSSNCGMKGGSNGSNPI